MKRQAIHREKILANHICNKRLEDLYPIHQRGYVKGEKMKRHSKSLAIREMQITAMMRYHYTSIRMTKIKKQ